MMKINQRSDFPEKIVVLVNCYYILASSLKQYLEVSTIKINQGLRDEYQANINNFYDRGMQLSIEYLGKKSLFGKLFKKLGYERPLTDRLPMVIKLPPKDSKEEE